MTMLIKNQLNPSKLNKRKKILNIPIIYGKLVICLRNWFC